MLERMKDPQKAADIFGEWQDTILWSCLQDVMGDVFVTEEGENASSAAAWLGDFCRLGGTPDRRLIEGIFSRMREKGQEFLILVPKDETWSDMIETGLGDHARRIVRYAIKKEPGIFDRKRLEQAVLAVGDGFELSLIDRRLYEACLAEGWSRDLVSRFVEYESFRRLGLGVAALRDGKPVSGASSYSRYREGIEIEIDTKPEYRRKGLAYACGAKLILECMDRGLYPSWDAQNPASVALAEKLGYHFDREYTAYEVFCREEG